MGVVVVTSAPDGAWCIRCASRLSGSLAGTAAPASMASSGHKGPACRAGCGARRTRLGLAGGPDVPGQRRPGAGRAQPGALAFG
jgi:hypothetical protein